MVATIAFPGYEVSEIIYQSPRTRIYRARREIDQRRVVIKVPAGTRPSLREVARYQNEYTLLRDLHLPHVVEIFDLVRYEQTHAVVEEDFGARSLAALELAPISDWGLLLDLAAQVTRGLMGLHQRGIIHKDINPSNILYAPEQRLAKITDFGISTVLQHERPDLKSQDGLEGTLSYIAPEQTGRISQGIDFRSDLYSLGATLYHLAAGAPPFAAEDALALVHAHVASVPVPLALKRPDVPAPLAAVIMKLLAKAPEHRYQSAAGLLADLEHCRQEYRDTGGIAPFDLGRHDAARHLAFQHKLYGRDAEVAQLKAAFERTCEGGRGLLLISGHSGAGKSSLVAEVYLRLAQRHGLFAAGKYEQFQRNASYAGLQQAVGRLVAHVQASPPAAFEDWRQRLHAALGQHGQVLVDFVPALGHLLGPQPPLAKIGPSEAEARFDETLARFIRVFAAREHPLLLCLEDLQRADGGTLRFLRHLLGDDATHSILVVGTYRSNEVDAGHPLRTLLTAAREHPLQIEELELRPLSHEALVQMFSELLRVPADDVQRLAATLGQKTQRNPFFLERLVQNLHEQGLIAFDLEQGRWRWDDDAIAGVHVSDDVVDLMTPELLRLPEATRELLKLAACLGTSFTWSTLSTLSGRPLEELSRDVWPAVQSGLLWAGREECRFLHDRIQQAAHRLIPEAGRPEWHLRVGRRLLTDARRPDASLTDPQVLAIIAQFDRAPEKSIDRAERAEVAQLALRAAKIAWASGSWAQTAGFAESGLRLLGASRWAEQRDLAIRLTQLGAEGNLYAGRFDEAAQQLVTLLETVEAPLEKAGVLETMALLARTRGEVKEAIALMRRSLQVLGIDFPDESGAARSAAEMIAENRARLGERRVADLHELPAMIDPVQQMCCNLLSRLAHPLYFTGQIASWTLAFAWEVNLCLRYGNDINCAAAYAGYGAALALDRGRASEAYEYGCLGLRLRDEFPVGSGRAANMVGAFVSYLREPMRSGQRYMREAVEECTLSGHIAPLTTSAALLVMNMASAGAPLSALAAQAEESRAVLRKAHESSFGSVMQLYLGWAESLRQSSLLEPTLSPKFVDMTALGPLLASGRNPLATGVHHFLSGALLLIFGRGAAAHAELSQVGGVVLMHRADRSDPWLFKFLAATRAWDDAGEGKRAALEEYIDAVRSELISLADMSPQNFDHFRPLAAAESARICGDTTGALRLYEQAIAGAEKRQFTHHVALFNELAAQLCLSCGWTAPTRAFLESACYAYERWGAQAKLNQLIEAHPVLLAEERRRGTAAHAPDRLSTPRGTAATRTMERSSEIGELDLTSFMHSHQAISQELAFERLEAAVMRILLENAGAERGWLLMTDAHGQLALRAHCSGQNYERLDRPRAQAAADLPWGVIDFVCRQREGLICHDAEADERFAGEVFIREHHVRSLLCVPILARGKLLGVVLMDNNLASGVFTAARLHVIKLLTAQAAISLENATLYNKLEEKVAERTAQLQEAQQRLIRLEKETTETQMAGGFAHEMRNALSGAQYALRAVLSPDGQVLGVPAEDPNAAALQQALEIVRSSVVRGLKITGEILDYARVSSLTPGQDVVDLNGFMVPLMAAFGNAIKTHAIELSVDCPAGLDVQVKEEHLWTMLRNLITNACDALATRVQPRKLAVRVQQGEGRVIIQVEDNGRGITPDAKRRIFQPFFSTKGAAGTGLGLGLSRKLAELHGGTLEFSSEVDVGTTFTLVLPQRAARAPTPSRTR